jgi:hypothetical protein
MIKLSMVHWFASFIHSKKSLVKIARHPKEIEKLSQFAPVSEFCAEMVSSQLAT